MLAGVLYQAIATAIDNARYPPPGTRVDVGGHRLHISCAGEGRPIVVMEAGAGGSSLDWSCVQPEIARFTRVCAYDRAGFGWSDSGPKPRTSLRIVEELHTLLHNAGIEAPYVLVGHSLGGLNVRLFASRYPDEVVGIVLVDAVHEDVFSRFPPEFHDATKAGRRLLRFGRMLAPFGIPRLLRRPLAATDLPPAEQRMALALGVRAKAYGAALDEAESIAESTAQLRTAQRQIGDLPLAVLSSPATWDSGTQSGEQMGKVWMEAQRELAGLSSHSKHVIADRSGHFVQIDQPALVVDAVRDLVQLARAPNDGT